MSLRSFSPSGQQPSSRPVNTSRTRKAVNDSSTVDFVYLPRNLEKDSSDMNLPRVPILPDAFTHYEYGSNAPAPMKPEIYAVSEMSSDVAGPSPMSEVVDNHAVEIDPFELTEAVSRARYRANSPYTSASGDGDTVKGTVKELWNGLLDDLLGPKQRSETTQSN